jgi:heme A synthase
LEIHGSAETNCLVQKSFTTQAIIQMEISMTSIRRSRIQIKEQGHREAAKVSPAMALLVLWSSLAQRNLSQRFSKWAYLGSLQADPARLAQRYP